MISGGFAKAETRIFSSNSLFFIALCFLKFQLETFFHFCRFCYSILPPESLYCIVPKSQYKKKAEHKV